MHHFRLSPSKRCGYTLLEVLIVMLIMGLLLGLVTAVARPDERSLLQLEAERLAQLLNLAAAESRLSGKPMRWTSDGRNYSFWRRLQGEWAVVHDNDLFRPRILPAGMSVADFTVEATQRTGAMRLDFMTHGLPLAYSIELAHGAHRAAISAAPLGEATTRLTSGNTDGTTPP